MKPTSPHQAAVYFCAALFSASAFPLGENFTLYESPHALLMGGAITPHSNGLAALFHNPAGLGQAYRKDSRTSWTITPIAIDIFSNFAMVGAMYATRNADLADLFASAAQSPGGYHYLRSAFVPSAFHRNFGFAGLAKYEVAVVSDGTNADVRAGHDIAMVTGLSTNLSGNLVKLGVNGKAILRNQLSGTFSHAQLSDPATINSLMKEGLGFGFDGGMLITLPMKYLPTLGISVKDVLGVSFMPTNYLNPSSTGAPSPIAMSYHVGVSVSPSLGKGVRSTFVAEIKNLELVDLDFMRRLHFGMELVTSRSFYVWGGFGAMNASGGFGLRTYGGDLEIGFYGVEVGTAPASVSDTRFVFHYTIGF